MQVWRVGDVRRAARRGLERPGDTGRPRGRTVDPGVEALRSTGDSTRRRGQRRRSPASVLSILSPRSRGWRPLQRRCRWVCIPRRPARAVRAVCRSRVFSDG